MAKLNNSSVFLNLMAFRLLSLLFQGWMIWKSGTAENITTFYTDCNTPQKLCGGFGTRKDCISTKNCRFAGAVSENSTAFIIQTYTASIESNDTFKVPCYVTGTMMSDVFQTTEWIKGEGYVSKLHCKEKLSLNDFFPYLYFNGTVSNLPADDDSVHEQWSLGWSVLDKSTMKSECEARLKTINSENTVYNFMDGSPGIQVGGSSFSSGCFDDMFTQSVPGNRSWTQVLKDVKPYDGIFHTNLKSGKN